ncbi:hypothetical protein PROFUN_03601 [Planoprotostelium fungivorum]|uniref:Uncharacterized protein n=1 Tax=Planoprotostelium fungivorum TaxID=1890364 RepID=A0A2P6MSJ6_9EUKA|nr:hypothetical protein PROFUN_03601 [Planoprotostelium fungivorum]
MAEQKSIFRFLELVPLQRLMVNNGSLWSKTAGTASNADICRLSCTMISSRMRTLVHVDALCCTPANEVTDDYDWPCLAYKTSGTNSGLCRSLLKTLLAIHSVQSKSHLSTHSLLLKSEIHVSLENFATRTQFSKLHQPFTRDDGLSESRGCLTESLVKWRNWGSARPHHELPVYIDERNPPYRPARLRSFVLGFLYFGTCLTQPPRVPVELVLIQDEVQSLPSAIRSRSCVGPAYTNATVFTDTYTVTCDVDHLAVQSATRNQFTLNFVLVSVQQGGVYGKQQEFDGLLILEYSAVSSLSVASLVGLPSSNFQFKPPQIKDPKTSNILVAAGNGPFVYYLSSAKPVQIAVPHRTRQLIIVLAFFILIALF